MTKKTITLTESELRKFVANIAEEALNEIGYRGAALAQGANYNASIDNKNNNINAKNKMDKAQRLRLPALNQAISDNFDGLYMIFIETDRKSHMSYTVRFQLEEIIHSDMERFVMYGKIRIANENPKQGRIEYQFKSGKFYRVNFYGNGTIRRINPLEIDWETKDEVYRFLTFMSIYLYAIEDYENHVNVNGSTPSKKH